MRRLVLTLVAAVAFAASISAVPVYATGASIGITRVELVDRTTVAVTGTVACPSDWHPETELVLTQRTGKRSVNAYGVWTGFEDCNPAGQAFTARLTVFGGGSLHPGRGSLSVGFWGWRDCECGEGGETPDYIPFTSLTKTVVVRP